MVNINNMGQTNLFGYPTHFLTRSVNLILTTVSFENLDDSDDSLCDLLSKNTATSKQSERIHTIPTRRLSVIFPKLCWTLDTISMPTIYHLLVTIVSELETGGQTHGKQTTRARYTETVEVGEPEPKLDPNSLLK